MAPGSFWKKRVSSHSKEAESFLPAFSLQSAKLELQAQSLYHVHATLELQAQSLYHVHATL